MQDYYLARVHFFFLQSAWRGEHDDRKGHHYYIRTGHRFACPDHAALGAIYPRLPLSSFPSSSFLPPLYQLRGYPQCDSRLR